MDQEIVKALKVLVDKGLFSKAQAYDILIKQIDNARVIKPAAAEVKPAARVEESEPAPAEVKPAKRKYTKRKGLDVIRWNNTEDHYIINNYNEQSPKEIAEYLKRKPSEVKQRIAQLREYSII